MVDQVTFPETVTVLKSSNGSVVYLVGTAHFSEESQEDVSQVYHHDIKYKINNIYLDVLCFLCNR
jgi:hypothetical protein